MSTSLFRALYQGTGSSVSTLYGLSGKERTSKLGVRIQEREIEKKIALLKVHKPLQLSNHVPSRHVDDRPKLLNCKRYKHGRERENYFIHGVKSLVGRLWSK